MSFPLQKKYLFCYNMDMAKGVKNYRILVALRLAYASNRAFLRGIARFRRSHPYWRVTVQEGFTDFSRADSDLLAGFDGLITAQPHSDEGTELLSSTPLPIAVIGYEPAAAGKLRTRSAVLVRGAAEDVGVLAARHFLSLGDFHSYAFVATSTGGTWSEAREKGFREELRRHGIAPTLVDTGHPDGSPSDERALAKRLAALDKPAALFCAYDNRALQALQACEAAGIAVPREASVIGVDNDTTLCDFSNPSITSIAIDQVVMGEIAASGLDRLLRKRSRAVQTVTVRDVKIVERESTAHVVPAKHLVDRARRFIAENATAGIRVGDVVSHLGVSRALADRRFKEFTHSTINEDICRARIAAAKRLLAETGLSIALVTERCGFAAPQYAKRLFKKETGVTMKEWRSQHGTSPK